MKKDAGHESAEIFDFAPISRHATATSLDVFMPTEIQEAEQNPDLAFAAPDAD